MLQPFATMTIAFIVIGVCAVRLMGNFNYWSLMKPPQKIFKFWVHIYYFIKFYYFISSYFQQKIFYICDWCRWGLLPYSKTNFTSLAKQFHKGTPTFCIMKNITTNNNGDVRLLTIVSLIIVQVLFLSTPKVIERSFNLHFKHNGPIISRKVNILSFNPTHVHVKFHFSMFVVSILKHVSRFF